MKREAIVLALGLALLFVGTAQSGQRQGKSQAEKLFARATPDDYIGDESCASCHEEVSRAFPASGHAAFMAAENLPNGKKGCEGCHGPGGIHQADENSEVLDFNKMTAKEVDAACMRCHDGTFSKNHWSRTVHARADVSCVDCHQIHPGEMKGESQALDRGRAIDPRSSLNVAKKSSKALLKAEEVKLCGQCHTAVVSEFRNPSHHPVPEGTVACSDCHTPHPTKANKTRKDPVKGECITCHTEFAGPFVHEHDPVAGFGSDGCQECHRPHGSSNPKMLNSVTRGLCAQCHTDKIGNHYPGQTCWTAGCHVATHGSNTSRHFLTP